MLTWNPIPADAQPWPTASILARWFRVDPKTIRSWVQQGGLPQPHLAGKKTHFWNLSEVRRALPRLRKLRRGKGRPRLHA
jgi:hypothetical protein